METKVKYTIGDLVSKRNSISQVEAVEGITTNDDERQQTLSPVKYTIGDLVKRKSIVSNNDNQKSTAQVEISNNDEQQPSSPIKYTVGDLMKRKSMNLSVNTLDINNDNDKNTNVSSLTTQKSIGKEETLTWRDVVSDDNNSIQQSSPRSSIKYSPADLVKRKSLIVDTSSNPSTPSTSGKSNKEGWFSNLTRGLSFSSNRSRSASAVSAPSNKDDDSQSNSSDESSKVSKDSKDSDTEDENIDDKDSIHEEIQQKESLQGEGLMGFLYREKEKAVGHDKEYIKCWVELHSHKLMYTYSETIPTNTSMAAGFIVIDKDTEVNLKFHVFSSGVLDKEQFFFSVRHSEVATTFCTNTEVERDKWVLIIRNCIDHFSLMKPRQSKLITELNHLDHHSNHSELPRKVGSLKKRALGGKFTARVGITSNKKRWFRLDGGVLMYYADKDMRPSKLKGTISLENSTLLKDNDNDANSMSIRVELQDGKILHCEADTTKIANEWRVAFSESIEGLQKVRSHATERRVNVADQSNDSETVPQLPLGSKKPQKSLNAIKACLSQHFLVQSIQEYDEIIDALQSEIFYPNDVIIYQGIPGSKFYIAESGEADIIKDGQIVGKVKSGSTFGELALLNSVSRTATVKANEVCQMWSLEREIFRIILRKQEEKVFETKLELLNNIPFFDQIGLIGKRKICNNLYLSTFSVGEKIFKQGDKGDAFYIIISGSVSLLQSALFGGASELIKLKPNSYFGEKALLEEAPRAATAIALSKVECWTIDKRSFTTIFGSMKEALSEAIASDALRNVTILKNLSSKQLEVIARSLTSMTYNNDDMIIEQGQDGDSFYIIQSGEVAVQVNHIEVAKLGVGSFFGELALLKNEKRNATVISKEVTSCLVMKRDEFNNLIGPLESIINSESKKREVSTSEKNLLSMAYSMTRRVVKNNFNAKSAPVASPKASEYAHSNFQLSSLNPIKFIKKGTFSMVYLAQNVTGRYFALKVMHKKKIYDLNLMTTVFREREILRCLDHPFIVPFYSTISDANSLYIVEKYIEGPDFYDYLIEKKNYLTLSSNSRKFYAANILSIITYLFEEDIVYRDLKPENFVMDGQGYLTLVDFGCAKRLPPGCMTNTMCGNPEYLAPEVVLSKGHFRAVDLWAFGVLLYEMVKGFTPFTPHDYHGNLTITYQNILHSKDVLSKSDTFQSFDKVMAQVVKELLNENPYMRMGMLRDGIKEIWKHPFLTGYDQDKIYHRSLPAPYTTDNSDSIDSIFIYEDINIEEAPEYTGAFDFSSF